MMERVALRVENSGMIERFYLESLTGIFYAIDNDARRLQIADLNTLLRIVLSAILDRIVPGLTRTLLPSTPMLKRNVCSFLSSSESKLVT